MELTGIEPVTSWLQTRRSPRLSYSPGTVGVDERRARPAGLVGLSGFEPLTSRLSAVRSSQLSYRPVAPPRGAKDPRVE